jgi:hypothetical protein
MSLPEEPTLQDAELYAIHLIKSPKTLDALGPSPFPKMLVELYKDYVRLKEVLNGITAKNHEADRGDRVLFPLPREDG